MVDEKDKWYFDTCFGINKIHLLKKNKLTLHK